MTKPLPHISVSITSSKAVWSFVGKHNWQKWLLAGALVIGTPLGMAEEDEVTAEQVVGAIEATFGVTPGERRNHTKGTCAAGEFVGEHGGQTYSRSGLFSGKPIPVVARFSLGGGNPKAADAAKSVRGMALEFRLSDGGVQHMTMLNTPVFGAAGARTFLDMMIAIGASTQIGRAHV